MSHGSPPRGDAATYERLLGAAGGSPQGHKRNPSAPDGLVAALYVAPPYRVAVPALGVARLSVNLVGGPVTGHLEGDRSRRFDTRRHSLFLTPAGAAARWHKHQASSHINLYFDAAGIDDGDSAPATRLLADGVPMLNASVRGLGGLIDRLAAELRCADTFADEAADSLGRLLLIQLARRRGGAQQKVHPLSARVLHRVTSYVREHLGERLLVADLAAVAGVPPSQFAAAFGRHTGQSPHQFVLAQRVARAASLLRHSTLPLAAVASAAGFANQQHMTRTLRERLALTPAALRQQAVKDEA